MPRANASGGWTHIPEPTRSLVLVREPVRISSVRRSFERAVADEILENHVTRARLKREQPRRLMDVEPETRLLLVRGKNGGRQLAPARLAEAGVPRRMPPIGCSKASRHRERSAVTVPTECI